MPQSGLVAFDLDGTLQAECRSSWELLHRKLGLWDPDGKDYLDSYLRNEIDYFELCRRDASLWKGMPIADLRCELADVQLIDGADEVGSVLHKMGHSLALISTGVDILAEDVARRLGFDYCVSNHILTDQGMVTGDVEILVPWDGKGEVLERLQQQHGISMCDTVSIGDSGADIPMFERSGLSIAVDPTVDLEQSGIADAVLSGRDFVQVLRLISDSNGRHDR